MGIGAQMVLNMIAKAEGKAVKPLKEEKKTFSCSINWRTNGFKND